MAYEERPMRLPRNEQENEWRDKMILFVLRSSLETLAKLYERVSLKLLYS